MIEIEQHKIIVELSKKLLNVCFDSQKDIIKNLIKNSKNEINNFNSKELTVVDASKSELGLFKSAVKKIIYGKFLNVIISKINKDDYNEDDYYYKKDEIRNEFKNACNKTFFEKDLINKYILLSRKIENIYFQTPLEKALKETLHLQIITEFQNQNIKLINKYL